MNWPAFFNDLFWIMLIVSLTFIFVFGGALIGLILFFAGFGLFIILIAKALLLLVYWVSVTALLALHNLVESRPQQKRMKR